MKHLIGREDYIKEYLRFTNEKNENELYEGLLNTVFGGLKMLLNKDWANIKCKNASVIPHLKSIDKTLSGYTMTKMEFSGECATIRQNIANYFSDLLDYKLGQISKIETEKDVDEYLNKEEKNKKEVEEKDPDAKKPEEKKSVGPNFVSKLLNIKDDKIIENLKKYQENIKIACSKSPKLKEYSDQMLNSVIVFVNDVVISELEKKGVKTKKLEELRKKNEEDEKKLNDIRKKMDTNAKKAGEESLKKLSSERDAAMKALGVTPIGAMDGDKSIDTIVQQFKGLLGGFDDLKLNESVLPGKYSDKLKNDSYLGIQQSLEELDWNISKSKINKDEALDKFIVRVILSKINTVFKVISNNDNKKLFKTVPSASVQAMMVALSNAVIYGIMGDKFNIEKEERISLLTKCAIDSDATIGFNLPLIDAKNPKNGNFFVSIMNKLKDVDIKTEVEGVVSSTNDKEKNLILKVWKKHKSDMSEDDVLSVFVDWSKEKTKEFRQNMDKLFNTIVKKADELKKNAEKERESEAKNEQAKDEANDKK